ncbi:MAG: hypothetical protein IJZ80_07300 [Clostridia bacterium]|nr:hypothetical protein [Clostridia bacterium]
MREEMEKCLKEELRELAILTRDRLGLKQKNMAEELEMCNTSYSDIETGIFMCGTLTAFLLLMKQPDPNVFLMHLKEEFQKIYDEAGKSK